MAKLGERKRSCAVEPRGCRKGIFDTGVNEFLNECLCVNLIRFSKEAVTLTFTALNVRHVLQEKMGNVNSSAKMKRVDINIKPVLKLSL